VNWAQALLASLTAVCFQALGGPVYALEGATPHFVLLVVSFVALRASARLALSTAVATGLLLDFLSLDPWGANTLALSVAAGILSRAAAAGWCKGALPRAAALALALALALACRWGFLGLWCGALRAPRPELAAALYSWLLALPLFALLGRMRPLLLPRERRR
jgi:rod shape-determining protein MreD